MNEQDQMKAALAVFEAAHGRRSRALVELNGMKPIIPPGSDPTPSSPAAWEEFKQAVDAEDAAYEAYVRARDAWVATLK